MQNKILYGFIGALIMGIISFAVMLGMHEAYTRSSAEYAQAIKYHECGVCGARIIEYWQIRDMNDDDWVKLCQFCYRDIAYE